MLMYVISRALRRMSAPAIRSARRFFNIAFPPLYDLGSLWLGAVRVTASTF
jgi:hypothetical protein